MTYKCPIKCGQIKCHEFVKGGVYVSSNQTTFPDLVSEKIGSSSMLQKTKLSDDENGSVRLVGQKFPEVFWDGIWTPICGYWFWNNDNGADLFCFRITVRDRSAQNMKCTFKRTFLIG